MGTSQSNPGPNGRSPLIPPWADNQPQQPLPQPLPARFKPFRQAMGKFISTGDRASLEKALGHYARTASGGSSVATRRLSNASSAGGGLFGVLTGNSPEIILNLSTLTGLTCAAAISLIVEKLTPQNGDSEKIRHAMNDALVNALDGVDIFDPKAITDDLIIDVMINYLTDNIFLQIVNDTGKSWNKAKSPIQEANAETALRELIKVLIDQNMSSKITSRVRELSSEDIEKINKEVIIKTWEAWEKYK